jgi:hypothetical protein
MTVYNEAQFMSLCQQASIEQDPKKLLQLVNEITAMLDDKQQQLAGRRRSPKSSSADAA